MPTANRSFNIGAYRYGMNGQEKDDEIAPGIYSAEYWEYDSRLGRRWEMDPMVYDWQSPYATFDNNPIVLSDVSGLYSDPPGTTTTKPQVKVKTFGDIVVEGLEKELNKIPKSKIAVGIGTIFETAVYVIMPHSMGTGDMLNSYPYRQHPIFIGDPSKLSNLELQKVKEELNRGKGL